MRAFVAIDLPEEVTDALSDLTSVLPVGRSVPDDNLHLTLAFLGEQTEDQLEQLHQALRSYRFKRLIWVSTGLGALGAMQPRSCLPALQIARR